MTDSKKSTAIPLAINPEKIALVRSTAQSMSELSLADINLIMYEAGLEEISAECWHGDEHLRWESLSQHQLSIAMKRLRELSYETVVDIAATVRLVYNKQLTATGSLDDGPLRMFASHLVTQKDIVARVAQDLHDSGISMFVAHESIQPDDEWHSALETSLDNVHAGVVFLHEGFTESEWCNQEVGWLLGRRKPCYPIAFSQQPPLGLLGKKQAHFRDAESDSAEIAADILDWVSSKPELRPYLTSSLTQALEASPRFYTTDQIWLRLKELISLNSDQVSTVLRALLNNHQVHGATCGRNRKFAKPYANVILPWLRLQPGFPATQEAWEEVAEIREFHLTK